MGYTHYWRMAPADTKDAHVRAAMALALTDMLAILTSNENEVPIELHIFQDNGERSIVFNGVSRPGRDDSHETFHWPIPPTDSADTHNGQTFECTKTARKPYDVLVVACLAVAAMHCGEALRVSSDGDRADWAAGVQLASHVLGAAVPNPIPKARP